MLLPLHAPHDTPTPVPMRQGKGNRLGSILRHAIMIVLIQDLQVRAGPAEHPPDRYRLQVQVDCHRGAMTVPLKTETGTGRHQEHEIFRKSWVHLAQLGEVDLHEAQSSPFPPGKAIPVRESGPQPAMQIESPIFNLHDLLFSFP
jgi:hypothetical protein